MMCGTIVLVLSLILQGSAAASEPLPAAAFDYLPLKVAPPVTHQRIVDGIAIRDVEIAKTAGGVTKAYVVAPLGSGPFGGALMVHWLGEEDSNRNEFLDDAVALARHGIVSVLPDAMWSAPHWYTRVRSYATDYERSLEQVKDLRRALDVLLLQPGVDPRTIAYVGHDFGAMYGAVMAGVERRARYYVFMAGTTSFNDWYLYGKPPPDVSAYKAQMAPLDPILYLHEASIDDALFQFARHDFYVPPAKFAAFYVADHRRKLLRLYDTEHALALPAAIEERRAWLIQRLARQPIPRNVGLWTR